MLVFCLHEHKAAVGRANRAEAAMNSDALAKKAHSLDLTLVDTNQGWTICKGHNVLSGVHLKNLKEVRSYLNRVEEARRSRHHHTEP